MCMEGALGVLYVPSTQQAMAATATKQAVKGSACDGEGCSTRFRDILSCGPWMLGNQAWPTADQLRQSALASVLPPRHQVKGPK